MFSNESINLFAMGVDYKKLIERELAAISDVGHEDLLAQIYGTDNVVEKFVILRNFTSPQGTLSQQVIMKDLLLDGPKNEISGDARKGGVCYEIKVSIHAKNCSLNIRQIRPHHDVDFYIIAYLNIFKQESEMINVFKIPTENMYDFIVKYGGYTHGTFHQNGPITIESVRDRSKRFEYSLTYNPSVKGDGKNATFYKELLKFKVDYSPENF